MMSPELKLAEVATIALIVVVGIDHADIIFVEQAVPVIEVDIGPADATTGAEIEAVERSGAVDHSDEESPHLIIAAISERSELFWRDPGRGKRL